MIPKKIHFCWMSGDPYPAKIKRCMKTWRRVMPDYEIKLWNAQNFDVEGAPDYVREAIRQIADLYGARIVESTGNTIIVELTEVPSRIDAFLDVISNFEVLEMCRSGVTAIQK